MTAPKGHWKLSETHHGGYSCARKNGKCDLISFPKYHSKSTENKSRHKKFTSSTVTQLKDNIMVLLHYSQKKTLS
jgi:hypothetical protein